MPRYFSWVEIDEDGWPLKPEANTPSLSIYEPDPVPVRTGIIDRDGNPIMRADDREPIGFVRFKMEC